MVYDVGRMARRADDYTFLAWAATFEEAAMIEINPVWLWIAAGFAALVLAALIALVVLAVLFYRRQKVVLSALSAIYGEMGEGFGEVPQRLVQALIDLERRMNQRDGRKLAPRQPQPPQHGHDKPDPLLELAKLMGEGNARVHAIFENDGSDDQVWPRPR